MAATVHASRPADVVADDHGVPFAQGRDQRRDVGRKRWCVVATRRFVARAVSAQVHSNGPVPGVSQIDQLLAPGPPELREAVQQKH
jgi:hypothetical protein